MIRLCALGLVLGLGTLACDRGAPAGRLRDDSGLAGTDTGDEPTGQSATQVGSEGFWGCPVDALDPISPSDPLPGLGVPSGMAAVALGGWSLQLASRADATTRAGSLTTAPRDWSLARALPPCEDFVVVGVEGKIERDGSSVVVSGQLGLRPGDATFLLFADEGAPEVARAWGLPADPDLPAFRFTLDAVEGSIAGVGSSTACADGPFSCDPVEDALDVTGVR